MQPACQRSSRISNRKRSVRLGYSPDDADAFVLTFAQPVAAGSGYGYGGPLGRPRAGAGRLRCVEAVANGRSVPLAYFVALVIEGALTGTVYVLIALSFVLVYRASSMMNFALGEWVVFAGLMMGLGLQALDLGAAAALAFAGLAMVGLAGGFYHLVMRRLVARPALSAIMATLGLGMVMRGSGLLFVRNNPGLLPPSFATGQVEIGGLPIGVDRLLAAAAAALCTLAVGGFYRFSRAGVALRAVADDPQAAMASGIDVDRQLLLAWALAGLVAAVAGVLWTMITGGGFSVALIGLKLFPIVILGGLDSIAGTVVAAIAIGVLESLGGGYFDESFGSGFGGIAPYIVLLAVLLLRPQGVFGRPPAKRV